MKKFLILTCILFVGTIFLESCRKDSKQKVINNHRKQPGSSANDLLSADEYEKLVVEIQYMNGFKPEQSTVDYLRQVLNERVNKPGGIDIIYTEISAKGKGSYSAEDLRDIENDSRTAFTSRKEIDIYVLFLDGEFSGNSGNSVVLGVAYYNTSVALFEKTIKDITGGFGEPSTAKLESTVLAHEIGHLLGLVNIGSPMVNFHQDTDHGNHCDNTNCLMYWEAETGGMVSSLVGSSTIPVFDDNCIADMRGNGGK